jgi:6-phosphogluconolactonase
MRLTTMPDPEAVAHRAAREIASHLERALARAGVAHLALSGGTTPARTYELLATEPLTWDAVEVWFVDERCVAPENELSNYRMAGETLLSKIKPARVHRMEGELGPEEGARRYQRELGALAQAAPSHTPPSHIDPAARVPVLDVAVLGIGPDGHVASLFPGAATIDAPPGDWCLGVLDSPKPPPERITLSLEVLRATRRCVLLATGAAKADALSAATTKASKHVPASLLARERLTVIADDAASPPPLAT